MTISGVELYEVWMPLKSEFRTSFGATRLRPAILVRILDSSGEEGWGEVVAGEGPWYSCETVYTAWEVLRRELIPLLPPEADPKAFIERASRVRGHNMAKAGVEMALWDLKARLERRPLYEMIGGERRPVKVGVSVGVKDSVEELLKTISYYLEKGYGRIKLKIMPGWDLEVVERVRREYPDIPLQVDANAAYRLSDWPHLKGLDKYGLLMLEQPLHYDDLVDHASLKRLLNTPLCLDESVKTPLHARWALQLDSADIVNLKPGRVGGIIAGLEIHRIWYEEAHRPLWIGGMLETGVGRAFLVTLATLPGVRFPSDISASDRYYEEDIITEPWTLEKGSTLSPRKAPGIGVEVDWSRLEKYTRRRWGKRLEASR
ncbi:MAG: o-succinylbenzoate synthase [Desulfurococcales archaeon]|nr:o-succinylbenzoate synthase [Desulfurococcales archaeon]